MPFPVDERYIHDAEVKLGARFPQSYRDQMSRENGGSIQAVDDDWDLYPVLDTSDRKRLGRTANDVVRETASARERRRFPQYAVAFAGNGTGDQLVFLPSQADRTVLEPQVYMWSHETGELMLVADDVSQLERS